MEVLPLLAADGIDLIRLHVCGTFYGGIYWVYDGGEWSGLVLPLPQNSGSRLARCATMRGVDERGGEGAGERYRDGFEEANGLNVYLPSMNKLLTFPVAALGQVRFQE